MSQRLLDELKQTRPFATLHGEAAVALLRTAALFEHALNEALKPHKLTATQYNVLRILRGAGEKGLCGRDVGERMIAPVPDVTRMLDRMEVAGLVKKERDSHDRRHVTVRLSAQGRRRLEQVEPELEALERNILGRIPAERLRMVVEVLEEVRGIDRDPSLRSG